MLEGLFQPMHLLVILVVAVLIFGPKKLPELGSGLAKGIKSFKDGIKSVEEEVKSASNSDQNHPK
jgi:sec-independent protein translocase protein TatA